MVLTDPPAPAGSSPSGLQAGLRTGGLWTRSPQPSSAIRPGGQSCVGVSSLVRAGVGGERAAILPLTRVLASVGRHLWSSRCGVLPTPHKAQDGPRQDGRPRIPVPLRLRKPCGPSGSVPAPPTWFPGAALKRQGRDLALLSSECKTNSLSAVQ